MVYHTSPMPIIGSTFRAFEKKYGIKVQNYHATGNPLTVRFSSEAAAGRMIADVFYASDTTTYSSFPDLFQKLTAENFPGYARLPEVARLDTDLAVSPSQTSFAMFYNTGGLRSRTFRGGGSISPIRSGRAWRCWSIRARRRPIARPTTRCARSIRSS